MKGLELGFDDSGVYRVGGGTGEADEGAFLVGFDSGFSELKRVYDCQRTMMFH